jgi:hypothetical protein
MNGPLENETAARLLLACAASLGEVENLVRSLCFEAPEVCRSESEAVDLLTGPEIANIRHALRSLAMRLDRGAVGKS